MWTSELVGMLMGLGLTREGRSVLARVDPEGVPDALVRQFLWDIRENDNVAHETICAFLGGRGVPIQGKASIPVAFADFAAKLSAASIEHGPRYFALKQKAECLYAMTRFQNGDCKTLENVVQQITDLVKTIQGSNDEGANTKPGQVVGVSGQSTGGK
jgi:hypothetical protein